MGANSSKAYGQSFLDFFSSIGDFGSAVLGTLSGNTSGWAKYSDDMKNYGNDIAQTFTNNKYSRYSESAPVDLSYATGSSRIQSNVGSTVGGSSVPVSAVTSNPRSAVSAVYSSIGSPPPSNIMSISDPNTKMAIASSRGTQRASVNLNKASIDLQSANAISSASNGTAASNDMGASSSASP